MVTQVSISGETYNISQAPAVKQRLLLTILGSRILLYKTQAGISEINITLLKGALIGCGDELLGQIDSIVLYKTAKHGGTELVSIDNFQGSMMSYIELLAAAVEVNLKDFLDWLVRAEKEDGQAQ